MTFFTLGKSREVCAHLSGRNWISKMSRSFWKYFTNKRHIFDNFWRRNVNRCTIYISPRNILWFYALLHIYSKECHRSRQHLSHLGKVGTGSQNNPKHFGNILLIKGICWIIFDGEMITAALSTILLEIFCDITLYSVVILNNVKDADDNFHSWIVCTHLSVLPVTVDKNLLHDALQNIMIWMIKNRIKINGSLLYIMIWITKIEKRSKKKYMLYFC